MIRECGVCVCVRPTPRQRTQTNKSGASAKIFLLSSAKKKRGGVGSRKTSNIFNNYTYLQRCNEAILSISNQCYVWEKKEGGPNLFIFRSRFSFGVYSLMYFQGFLAHPFVPQENLVCKWINETKINKVQQMASGRGSFHQC